MDLTGSRRWTPAILIALAAGVAALAIGFIGQSKGSAILFMGGGPLAAIAIMFLVTEAGPFGEPSGDGPSAAWIRRRTVAAAALALLAAFATILGDRASSPNPSDDRSLLLLLHVPALSWLVLGAVVLGARGTHHARFVSVLKSIEAVLAAGILVLAGGLFAGISVALFGVLRIDIPKELLNGALYAAAGIVPVLAVAAVYEPHLPPESQTVTRGLASLLQNVARLFLAPTLLVLAIYLVSMPFRFMEPFHNRELLIVYNVTLFAVIALAVCATPVDPTSVSERGSRWLRAGLVGVASLAVIISLHAMAAIVYRTVQGGLTPNRLAVIGWNSINIAILARLAFSYRMPAPSDRVRSTQAAFGSGLVWYAIWTVAVIFVIVPIQYFARIRP